VAHIDPALARRTRGGDGAQIPAGIHLGIGDAMALQQGNGFIDGIALGRTAQVDPGQGVGESDSARAQAHSPAADVLQGLLALFSGRNAHDLPTAESPQTGEGADGRGEGPGAETVNAQGCSQHRRHLGRQRQIGTGGMGVQPADLALRLIAAGEGIDLTHPCRGRIDECGGRIATGSGRIEPDRDVGIHQKEGFLYGRERVPSA